MQCRESIFKTEADQRKVEIYHGTRKTSKPYVDVLESDILKSLNTELLVKGFADMAPTKMYLA